MSITDNREGYLSFLDSLGGDKSGFLKKSKDNQHYVFQSYLKSWKDGGKVWLRLGNEIKYRPTDQIANEYRFYRLSDFTDVEVQLYQLLIKHNLPQYLHKRARKSLDNLLSGRELAQQIAELRSLNNSHLSNEDEDSKEIESYLSYLAEMLDIADTNIMEETQGFFENEGSRWLDQLKKGNTEFYFSENQRMKSFQANNSMESESISERLRFLTLLTTQCYRTKAMREKVADELRKKILASKPWNISQNINFEKVVWLFLEMAFSPWVAEFLENSQANLTILENSTDTPFITSDQPVINLKEGASISQKDNEFILYYPLSPSIAIIVNDSSLGPKLFLTSAQVKDYNTRMAQASYEQIYANQKKILEEVVL